MGTIFSKSSGGANNAKKVEAKSNLPDEGKGTEVVENNLSEPAYEPAEENDSVIICCYFNPKRSPYRLKLFQNFYATIKHLEHRIIECAIDDAAFELANIVPDAKFVRTKSLLFHKEGLLNILIRDLPPSLKYVFWLDTDIAFTNKKWLPQAVNKLKSGFTVVQPFEFAIHMEKDMIVPSHDILEQKKTCMYLMKPPSSRRVWRSFAYNVERGFPEASDKDYDKHGHVGFAWGARRDVLDAVGGLYDRALIGGADHIMAHAIINGGDLHHCISKSHIDDYDRSLIADWSARFQVETKGMLGYVEGDVNHFWHGDLVNRDYFNRIRMFSKLVKSITQKDENGLYVIDQSTAADLAGDGDVDNGADGVPSAPHQHQGDSVCQPPLASLMDSYFSSREVDGGGQPYNTNSSSKSGSVGYGESRDTTSIANESYIGGGSGYYN